MAQQKAATVTLGLAMAAGLWAVAMSQSSSDCTNVLISMSPCLGYISGNSTTPSSGCCTQLGTVVRSQPQCLCQVLNGGASNLGLTINQTQALELPNACNVQTPPASQCNTNTNEKGAGAAPSPTGSGSGSPPITNSDGGGSKTSPDSSSSSSDYATGITAAFALLLMLLLA